MKNIILQFFIFSLLYSTSNIYSQAFLEQNSGVTVNLTSVSVNQVNNNNVWVCGNGGTIVTTSNAGTTWVHVISNGIPNTVNLVNIYCIDANNALTAGNSGTTAYVYRTSNSGGNWTQVFTQPNGYINTVWMKTTTQGIMCGNPVSGRWSLWKTTNGGLNWDSTGLYLQQAGSETGWNNSLYNLRNNVWFGTNNSRIYYSLNFGTSWQVLSTLPEINSTSVWFFYSDSTYGYFGGANSYKTSNCGLNWSLMTSQGSGNFAGFVDGLLGTPLNYPPMMSFCVRNDSSVYQTYNTSIWNRIYSAPAGVYRHLAPIYYSSFGLTWAVRSNGGITRVWRLWGGVNKFSSEVPDRFSLSQNYPNPFNPTTKIKFDIPNITPPFTKGGQACPPVRRGGLTSLKIYDILGREVATLVNDKLSPGTYEVEFDGSNYASGAYFYKITTSEYSETKRMILLK